MNSTQANPGDPNATPLDAGANLSGGFKDSVKFFLCNLFDLRMRIVISVCTLPIVYGLSVLLAGIWVIDLIVAGFAYDWLAGLFWLVVLGPLLFITVITALRVVLELMMAVFRLSMHMEVVVEQTGEIADDLPRLQFWKHFLGRKGEAKQ